MIKQIVFAVLVTIFLSILLDMLIIGYKARGISSDHGSASRFESDGLRWLCSFGDRELNGMIWSHRGSWPGITDASPEAVSKLAQSTITRFDVDVSFINGSGSDVNSHIPGFWIAHPATIQEYSHNTSGVQRLESFLLQTWMLVLDRRNQSASKTAELLELDFLPSVTLEPKFSEQSLLERWINYCV